MRKVPLVLVAAAVIFIGADQTGLLRQFSSPAAHQDTVATRRADRLDGEFTPQSSGKQVAGEGTVSKLLADGNDGTRHQRFIVMLPSGQTLLVAHNIDVAPRVASLKPGDSVAFNGVYEWNSKGGLIHWTHRDPSGRHQA